MVVKTSWSVPQELLDSIDADRPSTVSRSEWLRHAARERLNKQSESSGSEPEDTGATA